MKQILKTSILTALVFGAIVSCQLEETLLDSRAVDSFQLTSEDIDPNAALQPIYNSMSVALNGQTHVTALNLHSSDELMGPTRGTDWFDFGVWTTLHTHQWDPTHPEVLNAWNTLHQGVVRSNLVINALESGERYSQAVVLRSYLLWHLVDLFGQVPFREPGEVDFENAPGVLTRAEVAARIVADLEDIIANGDLPSAATVYGDPTIEAAQALLARVYLNKFIYDGATDASNEEMQKVVDACDAVINSGLFSLAGNYFSENFGVGNEASPEAIFVLVNDIGDNRGASFGSRAYMTLHYNQNPSGWNGFTTLADFYNRFDPSDQRFSGEPTTTMADNGGLEFGFLAGQQFDSQGNPLTQRNGSPLQFSAEVPLTGASEEKGIRVIKYEVDYANDPINTSVDYPLIRFADVLLMKAEAMWRMGDAASALLLVNEVRAARGVDPILSISGNGQEILDERGFEFYWEGLRRTDLVRFGQFNQEWEEKPASDATRNIFPIPQQAVDTNPNLVQNPGY